MLHHHAGYATLHIPLLRGVCLRLAACVSRIPLEFRETADWLRSNKTAALCVATSGLINPF
uniref:Uncharacterized protein n=1 Tax=Mesocestoides corti TaxID=53468 RepID=A0A5K3EMK1_MESCO